jgi:hypothetical protein
VVQALNQTEEAILGEYSPRIAGTFKVIENNAALWQNLKFTT